MLQRNNFHFYQMACCFVQQYRNCLIETVTKKFGRKQPVAYEEDKIEINPIASKSPECIPLICNDFLTSYLPLKCNLFPQRTAIGFTQHMCMWLFNRKFTKARLELLP